MSSNPWRERFVLSAEGLFPIPKSKSLQMAMISVNPPTAYGMLTGFTKLEKGDWLIQNASNSSVGCNVIGLAKSMGLKTINLVRREEVVNDLKLLGADYVVVDSPDIVQKIQQLEDIGPIRLGIDAIAGKATNIIAAVLSPGSKIVSYGLLESQFIHLNTALMV